MKNIRIFYLKIFNLYSGKIFNIFEEACFRNAMLFDEKSALSGAMIKVERKPRLTCVGAQHGPGLTCAILQHYRLP